MGPLWLYSSAGLELPSYAVLGGYDYDYDPIYVGRALHNGEHLPAKVIPDKGCAYVTWGGQEHCKKHYDLLVGKDYGWHLCGDGHVPYNAIISGYTADGKPLYVGRGHHHGCLSVGKVHTTHGCLYVPFGGEEISLDTYEVLVCVKDENWLNSCN